MKKLLSLLLSLCLLICLTACGTDSSAPPIGDSKEKTNRDSNNEAMREAQANYANSQSKDEELTDDSSDENTNPDSNNEAMREAQANYAISQFQSGKDTAYTDPTFPLPSSDLIATLSTVMDDLGYENILNQEPTVSATELDGGSAVSYIYGNASELAWVFYDAKDSGNMITTYILADPIDLSEDQRKDLDRYILLLIQAFSGSTNTGDLMNDAVSELKLVEIDYDDTTQSEMTFHTGMYAYFSLIYENGFFMFSADPK